VQYRLTERSILECELNGKKLQINVFQINTTLKNLQIWYLLAISS